MATIHERRISPLLTEDEIPPLPTATGTTTVWTPNQQAARLRIIHEAADLITDQGLSACTFRAVAHRSGLTKSTVHYYFDDTNELVDLSVNEILQRLEAYARERVLEMVDPTTSVEFLVRLFMGRDETPRELLFRDSMWWPAYTAHAWRRGAKDQILHQLGTMGAVFELALQGSTEDRSQVAKRANSLHNYLLGAMIQNIIQAIDLNEVARAVAALTGLPVDPNRC